MPAPAPGRAKRAAQAAPAGALAPELLLLILAHLRTPAADLAIRASGAIPRVDRALAASPRICRAWAAAATQELYAAVALPSVEDAACFLRTLRAHPALGARVRSIALPLCAACSSGGTRRPRARCQAADVFSEILCRLPNLKATRVQDMHVSPRAIHAALARVHELTIDNGFSACAAARHPQLVYCGGSMPNLRRLNLLGSPWEIPAPADGAGYFFPSLRVLSMTAIDASVMDVGALLSATSRLRDLHLDSVRAFVGPCSSCNVVSLAALAAPVSRTLNSLQLRRMASSGRLDPLPDVQHLDVDVSSMLAGLPLPHGVTDITLVFRDDEVTRPPGGLAGAADPFQIAGELWSWVARSKSPYLRHITLHASASSLDRLRAWQQAAEIVAKMLAQTGVCCKLRISQDVPGPEQAPEAPKTLSSGGAATCGRGWLARRQVFHHMQRMLKIL